MTMSIHEFLVELVDCQRQIIDHAPLVEVMVDGKIRQIEEVRCEHNALVIITVPKEKNDR